MIDDVPTAAELRQLLVKLLVGAFGGSARQWRSLIGEVEVLPIAFNLRCNWRVKPAGSAVVREVIGQTVALVAAEHPYARRDEAASPADTA